MFRLLSLIPKRRGSTQCLWSWGEEVSVSILDLANEIGRRWNDTPSTSISLDWIEEGLPGTGLGPSALRCVSLVFLDLCGIKIMGIYL